MSLNLVFISSEFNLSVGSSSESKGYLFEDFRLDVQRRMLYLGEREVVLPPKAIETLIALIELRGEIVRKGDLMKIIWADTIVEESNLDHYLHVYAKPFSHLYRIDTNGRDLRQLTAKVPRALRQFRRIASGCITLRKCVTANA